MREALNEPRSDGIADGDHDEGNRRGYALDRQRRGRSGSDDQVDIECRELGNELGESPVITFCPAVFDDDVPSLDVTSVAQALAKRGDEIGFESSRGIAEKADAKDLARLRARGQRQHGARHCQRDEYAPARRHRPLRIARSLDLRVGLLAMVLPFPGTASIAS